ncbi:MAG: ribonuclease III [Aestuariivirgaceae bacterium]|nr:ribonuclease III [Aestuariivirgaceae bacterium]
MGTARVKAEALAERIGHHFADPELLRRALTHASARSGGRDNNERMEFLGDRVLGLIIAEMLFERFPGEPEGHLARRLNSMVRLETCADVARTIGIPDAIRTAPNEPAGKLAQNSSVLGDACEALIAALYLDGGLDAARRFIVAQWADRIGEVKAGERDPKTALQEWALGRGIRVPDYVEISRTGPDHDPEFIIEVRVAGHEPAAAQGKSKRDASRGAAFAFLKRENIWP